MALPEKEDYLYQSWVVHLKKKNRESFKEECNANEKGKFTKVKNVLADFFTLQFDAIQPDKIENIHCGLTANCKTLYIIAFNLHCTDSITIIGAVQYSATPDGVWINWLGILADIQPGVSTATSKEIWVF